MIKFKNYPIVIHYIEEPDDEPYYMAYLPDFGCSACSAVCETIHEAIEELELVYQEVVQYYKDQEDAIPLPTGIRLLAKCRVGYNRSSSV